VRTSALNVGDCLQVREKGEKAGGREGGSGSSVSSVMGHIPIQWTFLIKVYSQGGARGARGASAPLAPVFIHPIAMQWQLLYIKYVHIAVIA